MLSRDEFIYHHVCGGIEAGPHDSRYRLVELTDERRRLLDAGCAVGYIGEFVRRSTPDRWVAGIELDPGAARTASPHYNQLIVGSLEDESVWRQLTAPFDAVIFGDVLEHTADPVRVLHLALGVMADDGIIVVSMPNVAYFKVRLRLLFGRFDYEEAGIMDRTHLRFFTVRTGQAMLKAGGFDVVHLEGVHAYPTPPGLPRLARLNRAMRGHARAVLTRRWPSLFAYQFIMVGVRTGQSFNRVSAPAGAGISTRR